MPRHRKSYTLIPRKIKSGKHVWYYRTYDKYGQRTVARSTGQTNKTLAENYCDELLRRGELVPVRDVYFNDFASTWWLVKNKKICAVGILCLRAGQKIRNILVYFYLSLLTLVVGNIFQPN